MSRKRKPTPDPLREGLMRAVDEVVAVGGVVLVGRTGQPFAFYPRHAVIAFHTLDPGAPGRLREAVERRLGEVRR